MALAGACAPAEYRSLPDLSQGAATEVPDILPLSDLLPPPDSLSTAAPESEAALNARNVELRGRADALAAPAPVAPVDTTDLQERAAALRNRADDIRQSH